MKSLVLFFPLLVLSYCEPPPFEYSLVIDENLQKFREDILSFQISSFASLGSSFFEFYNNFYSTLKKSILQPYIRLQTDFNKSCANFPLFNLEDLAARRLINICDDVQRFISRVLLFPKNVIDKYYPNPESLTSPTLLELIADDYFASMNKHLEFILPIYNQNQKCVVPLLEKFFDIYKQPIDEMINFSKKRMVNMRTTTLRRDFNIIREGITKLDGVASKISYCSEDYVLDTFGCLEYFLNFDCLKFKSVCGPVYKSIYLSLLHFKKIEAFYNVYEYSFEIVFEAVREAENLMLAWSNSIDECIKSE